MNKDFSQKKFLSFEESKILRILLELALYIEKNQLSITDSSFLKLKKYHSYVVDSDLLFISKINKEFLKIKAIDRQFQIYIMNLERFVGQSSKEYDFLISKEDKKKIIQKFPLVCILDSVRSAHNIGCILRNAECFAVQKVYLTGLSPKADHPQVIKTAMGCDQIMSWDYVEKATNLIQDLKNQGYTIYAIETANQAKDLSDMIGLKSNKIALIFGHELHGLSLEILQLSDEIIKIGLYGNKNSLNVAVSSGIVLNKMTELLRAHHE